MIDVNAVGNKTMLVESILESAMLLSVTSGSGYKFKIKDGDHTWLTLRGQGRVERVRMVGVSGDNLVLSKRGGDGTEAYQWPKGTCIEVEWNPQQLCEFVTKCKAEPMEPTGVEPGVVCLDSCKCITVDEFGRITEVTSNA